MHFSWKYFFLGVCIALVPMSVWVLRVHAQSGKPIRVIFTTPTPTPKPTATPTPTPIPTPTNAPTPTPKPTATPTPVPVSIGDINTLIDTYAGQYAVAADTLKHIAMCESGYNPVAVNGPYGGLFQFSSSTWVTYRNMMGKDTNPDLRFNAEESIQTAAFVFSLKSDKSWPTCRPQPQ